MRLPDFFPADFFDAITSIFNSGAVEVTVTYEALEEAAEEALERIGIMQGRCEELRDYNNRLTNMWDSEACEQIVHRLSGKIEALELMLLKFRKHAENLQQIAQQYITTAGQISGDVQGLSSDVIV